MKIRILLASLIIAFSVSVHAQDEGVADTEEIVASEESEVEEEAEVEEEEVGEGEPGSVEEAIELVEVTYQNGLDGSWYAMIAGIAWLLAYCFRIARKRYDWDKEWSYAVQVGLGAVAVGVTALSQDCSWFEAIASGIAAIGGPAVPTALQHGCVDMLTRKSTPVAESEPESEPESEGDNSESET